MLSDVREIVGGEPEYCSGCIAVDSCPAVDRHSRHAFESRRPVSDAALKTKGKVRYFEVDSRPQLVVLPNQGSVIFLEYSYPIDYEMRVPYFCLELKSA